MESYLWVEQYRPKKVASCILPKSLKANFEELHNEYNIQFTEKEEIKMVKMISTFPIIINDTTQSLDIKTLSRFMYQLTFQFNKFYEKCPVLIEDKEIRTMRLMIVKSYQITMKILSELLDIDISIMCDPKIRNKMKIIVNCDK